MGIKCNMSDFYRQIDDFGKKFNDSLTEALAKAGEKAVERARNTKTYEDRTGNLSNSIGYGVVRNGSLVRIGGFGGGDGGQIGRSYLNEIAQSVTSEYALIIVAGMEYAIYVERKGFVVLDGGTLGIAEELRTILEGLLK